MINFNNLSSSSKNETIPGIAAFRTASCFCIVSEDNKFVTVFDENRDMVQVYPINQSMTTEKFAREYLNEPIERIHFDDSEYTISFEED